jgi:hypothetical protein
VAVKEEKTQPKDSAGEGWLLPLPRRIRRSFEPEDWLVVPPGPRPRWKPKAAAEARAGAPGNGGVIADRNAPAAATAPKPENGNGRPAIAKGPERPTPRLNDRAPRAKAKTKPVPSPAPARIAAPRTSPDPEINRLLEHAGAVEKRLAAIERRVQRRTSAVSDLLES